MGFLFNLKKAFGQEKEYEQTYPTAVHKSLKTIDNIFDESLPITEPHCSMEFIKKNEIEAPTHWIYKYVDDPIEMNYRDRSLRKSMIGHYDEAVKICVAGLEKFPNSPYLIYMLGRTLGDIGKASNDNQKLSEGITALNKVISLYPDFADAYVERGVIKRFQNDTDGANEDFTKANNIEPGILDQIKGLCCRCGKIVEKDCVSVKYPGISKGSYAISDPKPICQYCLDQLDDSDHTQELADLAICMTKNENDKAIQIVKSIFNKNNESHWYNLGNLYFRKGMLSEALDCFNNALLLNTVYTKAWYRKGTILMNQKNFVDASKCFKNILILNPKNENGWNPASAFCLLLCSVVIHNTTVQKGEDGKKTNQEVIRWLTENKPVWEFAFSKGFDLKKVGINGYIDFCFENQGKILDYLEPKIATVNIYANK
jgi:tetratricopeptide (TPR) repeat protein